MQADVAFLENFFGQRVAVVSVARELVTNPEGHRMALKELSEAVELQGFVIVPGAAHQPAHTVLFLADEPLRTRLLEAGWQKFPWKTVYLTFPTKPS
jgi:hypothetical protein